MASLIVWFIRSTEGQLDKTGCPRAPEGQHEPPCPAARQRMHPDLLRRRAQQMRDQPAMLAVRVETVGGAALRHASLCRPPGRFSSGTVRLMASWTPGSSVGC